MIKTIDRYILRYFIVSLILVAFAIGLLIIAINMIEELRDFVDHKVPFSDILLYYVYYAGWILKSFLPVFVLLAGLMSIGILARRNEILAMKASGVSLYRIATPLLVFSFFLSIGHIYYNEVIFAEANMTRVQIKEEKIRRRAPRDKEWINLVHRQVNKNLFFTLRAFSPALRQGRDIEIYWSDENKLQKLITADQIKYTSKGWMLYDVIERKPDQPFIVYDSLPAPYIQYKPEDFVTPIGKPEDMSYDQLENHIRLMKQGGENFQRELVDLKLKISYPFASFIVILICVPIASNPKRGGIAVSFALGAGIALIYFIAFKVIQSLGHSGRLDADVAAWSINTVFLLIGLVIMFRARK